MNIDDIIGQIGEEYRHYKVDKDGNISFNHSCVVQVLPSSADTIANTTSFKVSHIDLNYYLIYFNKPVDWQSTY